MTDLKEKNGTFANAVEYNFPKPREKVPFKHIIYNPSEKTFFGRTVQSWTKILTFYIIFYAVLALLFSISMQGLFSVLDPKVPRWQLDSSLIGTNPGLGYRPLAPEIERGSVIKLDSKNPKEAEEWISLLRTFIEDYTERSKLPNGGTNQKICNFNTTLGSNDVCAVTMDNFANCSPEKSFGYINQSPCVFLKLNRIYGWQPEFYDDVNNLPPDMPKDLVEHIKATPVNERKQIWISCKGQRDNDDELVGPMEYEPKSRGFPGYYYPYKNEEGYLSPLVAVRFLRPKSNELINVECRAWAKNIIYSGSLRDRQGSVSFQLLLD